MNARSMNLPLRGLGAVLAVTVALLMCGPADGLAHAAVAAPDGDAISIGDPDALGQIDLYVDPLCPYSGKMVQDKGGEIGKRIEAGKLRVNLRFVDFLDKYSASGTPIPKGSYILMPSSRPIPNIHPSACAPPATFTHWFVSTSTNR